VAKLTIEVDDAGALIRVAVDGENLGCIQHLVFAADGNGPFHLQVTLDGPALESGAANRSVSLLKKLSYCKLQRVDVLGSNSAQKES
jgi:hypothetical protein